MGSKQSGKHQGSYGVNYVQNVFLVWIILYDELIIALTFFRSKNTSGRGRIHASVKQPRGVKIKHIQS